MRPILTPTFSNRALTALVKTEGVTFEVERYSFSVFGGAKQCTIKATGSRLALRRLFNLIRGECRIYDGGADPVWWGCVWSVVIKTKKRVYGRTLDGFANKINVLYLLQTVNQIYKSTGSQSATGFSSDANSITDYGTWEKRIRGKNGSASAAIARQSRELAARKTPQKTESSGSGNEISAVITCRGWFDTLKARYWTNNSGNAAGFEQNAVITSETPQRLGGRLAPVATDYTFTSNKRFSKAYANMLVGLGTYLYFTGSASNSNVAYQTTAVLGAGGAYEVTPTSIANEGAGASVSLWEMGQKIYQTFQVTAEFYAAYIDIRCAKFNGAIAPADNIVIKLYTDSGSVTPNTLLATATISNAEVPTRLDWTTGTLDAETQLSPGTTYGIEISRSGSTTDLDCFIIGVDTALSYASGSLKVYGNATIGWKTRPTNADLIFKVAGVVETTTQIASIISGVGEFVTTTTINDASGLRVVPYQDGTLTAQQVILNLLEYGTSAGKRMLCKVSSARSLVVFKEPDYGTTLDLLYNESDDLLNFDQSPAAIHRCPYGVWIKDGDQEFSSNDEKYIFVDESEYNAINHTWKIVRSKDQNSDLELTRLEQ